MSLQYNLLLNCMKTIMYLQRNTNTCNRTKLKSARAKYAKLSELWKLEFHYYIVSLKKQGVLVNLGVSIQVAFCETSAFEILALI